MRLRAHHSQKLQKMKYVGLFALMIMLFTSCDDDTIPVADGPQLIFKFKFDPTQERLNGFGLPSAMLDGHAGQNPSFNSISAHYVELAPNAFTQLGTGEILYKNEETNSGGDMAIDFEQAIIVEEGDVFLSIPLSTIRTGTYDWLRVSLSYQNYDILLDAEVSGITFEDVTATCASFLGYNNYIRSYNVDDQSITVNGNRLQGYVGIETDWTLDEFQAPPGATTVPNPLFDSAPISSGSCVVTGEFDQTLEITGAETEDITIEMSLSTNNSFEWIDNNGNGKYEPLDGELVVDMGIRGMVPYVR